MKLGSLCTGALGLDMGIGAVLPIEHAWVADVMQAAAHVLAQHLPNVPNLGDITTIDWSTVEPVDIIAGGYPCQPFSLAGKRSGRADERHLWPFFVDAIRVLRPELVVLENVFGHLSMGFDRVLGDLASLGFDAEWSVVRASDVGACHRRERIFVAAHSNVRRRKQCDSKVRAVSIVDTNGNGATADANGYGLQDDNAAPLRRIVDDADAPGSRPHFGRYEPAVARWEQRFGHAPHPLTGRRLSPAFVEWMQGFPAGHVTDHVKPTAALTLLGNAVMPQQGAHAMAGLLERLAA